MCKDTPVAYIKGEDAGCEYLEVNEIIEDVWGINWQPPRTRKMVTSDLVYSPAQVTEHRCMELKDHDISEDTRRKFEGQGVRFLTDWGAVTCINVHGHQLGATNVLIV